MNTLILTLAAACAAGHTSGTPYYAFEISPIKHGDRLYHHSGAPSKRIKSRPDRRQPSNQRQIRKARRRMHAAGFKHAFR